MTNETRIGRFRPPGVRARRRWLTGAILMALVFAGCGSNSKSSSGTNQATSTTPSPSSTPTTSTPPATTASKPKTAPQPAVQVSIPGLQPGSSLARRYTCDGADTSPPISWSHIPAHTVEIDLLVASFENGREVTNWAVAGLSPHLHGLKAGHLPPGAIVGLNHANRLSYTVCPPVGTPTSFGVLVFPLPRKITVQSGFDPRALGQSALKLTEVKGEAFFSYKRT